MKVSSKVIVAALFLFGIIDLYIGYRVVMLGELGHFDEENGVLENLQALMLLLAMIVFSVGAVVEGRLSLDQKDYSILGWFGALLCFSFFLRELDVEKFDIPSIFIMLGSGVGKRIMLAVLWLSIIGYIVVNRDRFKSEIQFKELLFKGFSISIFLGGVLLVLGGFFDRKIFMPEHFQLYEELFEFNGYGMILVGAVLMFPSLRRL